MRTARKGIHAVLISILAGCTALQATPTLDLTGSGPSETIDHAAFRQADATPTGTDSIRCFVRLRNGVAVSTGEDAGSRFLAFDEHSSSEFIRSLRLGDVPIVNPDSADYRRFLLAIGRNRSAETNVFSLDKLEIYLGSSGSLLESPRFAGKVDRLAEAPRAGNAPALP